MRSIIFIVLLALTLQGCGGGDDSRYDMQAPVDAWQSYSSSPDFATHYWDSSTHNEDYKISKLPRIAEDFRSGYSFVSSGDLIFHNLANGQQFSLGSDGSYQPLSDRRAQLYQFTAYNHNFFQEGNTVWACNNSNGKCMGIDIYFWTFPYVYLDKNGKTLTITNWGDALIYDGFRWCRMSRSSDDVFECNPDEPKVEKPRAIQFYSSIKFEGKTLVGEWPTGSIYEFDGEKLFPSTYWTPPKFHSREIIGYEAQSMGMYCGDLFVGYWPRGEVWRFDYKNRTWSLFHRFFTDRTPDAFIPYVHRTADQLDPAFFGQRITSLTPYKDSLYATTSNLRGWTDDTIQDVVSADELDQYGAVYKIHKDGCMTHYASQD